MAAVFPNDIKTFTTKIDDVDDVMAKDINDLQDEVTAIEQHLTDNLGSVNLASNMFVFGFTDRSKVNVYLSGTDKDIVSIDVVSGSYQYYFDGEIVSITQNKSIQLTGSPHDNGMWFIYFTDNIGTLAVSQVPWDLLSHVPIAGVFWYQGNAEGLRSLHADELHTCAWPKSLHKNHHLTEGSKTVGSISITGYTLNTDTNIAVTFGVSASTMADEDIFVSLDALVDGNGTGANYSIAWHVNTTTYGFSQGNNFPYLYAPAGRVYYNNPSTGLVECSNGYYVNYYLWQTDFKGEARYLLMVGQSQYSLKVDAFSELVYSLNLTGFPAQEAVCVAQITIFTKSDKANTGKCWIERVVPVNTPIVVAASGGSGAVNASLVALSTGGFNGLFDSSIGDVQSMAERLDDMVGDGASIVNNKIIINSTNKRSINSSTTLEITDCLVLVDTSSEIVEVTLPDASLVKGDFIIKKVLGNYLLNIKTTSSQTIDGVLTKGVKNINTTICLRSDGSNYFIV